MSYWVPGFLFISHITATFIFRPLQSVVFFTNLSSYSCSLDSSLFFITSIIGILLGRSSTSDVGCLGLCGHKTTTRFHHSLERVHWLDYSCCKFPLHHIIAKLPNPKCMLFPVFSLLYFISLSIDNRCAHSFTLQSCSNLVPNPLEFGYKVNKSAWLSSFASYPSLSTLLVYSKKVKPLWSPSCLH